ncbi:tyrosine-type recombinase/integrase [Desulfofustis glycolicus]|uniref:Tyr recombinase domain-containing protein n=1 Tax=Desulfofustis glycolicus DSM 9705 TaxID=1121409 RepID=A0A1M5W0S8_9BACT|nr:site-specific integrase [Desulfofustis glycolicus]SHH81105.1 protein of unknown function [Desulfofustis glycolicus DSM 9705]
MVASKFKFTDAQFAKLQPHTKKRQYFQDTVQPGLRIQLTPKGVITFQFQRWSARLKKVLTKTLGTYEPNGLGIAKAREMAAHYLADLIEGKDIEQISRDIREEQTFEALFSNWLIEARHREKKTWETDQRRYELYIKKPLGSKKLSWFTRERIKRWHSGLKGIPSQRGKGMRMLGPHTANRCLALVSTVFNSQRPDFPNPTVGVVPFREQSRSRFLQPDELINFFNALESSQTPLYLRDFVYLSLFTGARRGNVGSMKWEDISLDLRTWTIPASDSKNKEEMVIPLADEVIIILERRKKESRSKFVFPVEKSKEGHLQAPRKSWASLLQRAGVENLRFHDLRRSMGSYMTIAGATTTVVGKGLGHRDKKSTAVYERLNLDPVRRSMADAIAIMKANRA